MVKQMFKLVWNRKKTNVLIIVEIFFSFLVLFTVATLGIYYFHNYRQPLGFSYENVWNIAISESSSMREMTDEQRQQMHRQFQQLLRELKDVPEVEAAGGIQMPPFEVGANNGNRTINGRQVFTYFNWGTDGLRDALGIDVVKGRWFQSSDDALDFDPVVVNEQFAAEAFPSEDPIGKSISDPKSEEKQQRIVGVIRDFRQHGEFHGLYAYCFERSPVEGAGGRLQNIAVKLRAGAGPEFEERLLAKLQAIARNSSFKIAPLDRMRRSHMKLVLTPVVAAALVAAFLIAMVGLGITGVLWQSIARRSREIGLRRAVGSPASGIYSQVLGELAIVTTIGVFFGVLLVVQLPLLDLASFLSTKIYLVSLMSSVALIYALTLVAGLYPSWLATKVQPATVLHAE